MYNQCQFVFCSAYIQGEISLVPSNPIEQTLELFVPPLRTSVLSIFNLIEIIKIILNIPYICKTNFISQFTDTMVQNKTKYRFQSIAEICFLNT